MNNMATEDNQKDVAGPNEQPVKRIEYGFCPRCRCLIYWDELLPKPESEKDNVWVDGVCPFCRKVCRSAFF
jgi:hypothetical protein